MSRKEFNLIGLTMGDAAGVGPEIILKAWRDGDLGRQTLIIGDYDILDWCNQQLSLGQQLHRISEAGAFCPGKLNVLDLGIIRPDQLVIGQVSRLAGFAASEYVKTAVSLALNNQIAAIVTLPMNKEATRLTIPDFSGHTELIAGLCDQTDYTMMLTSDKLTVSHVSTHVAMAEAVREVKKDRVLKVIQLTWQALSRYIDKPRIAVAGLNPHAGENGAFGKEELLEIAPAVAAAAAQGICCEGPAAPDTVFLKAVGGQYDAVVCMYHDQGHIPMKLLDFEGGVNVTLGLKVIRTSVDHGTAFDIAYKGIASTRSLVAAVRLAEKMAVS